MSNEAYKGGLPQRNLGDLSSVTNISDWYHDIPISSTDNTQHVIHLTVAGQDVATMTATGDGMGGVTSVGFNSPYITQDYNPVKRVLNIFQNLDLTVAAPTVVYPAANNTGVHFISDIFLVSRAGFAPTGSCDVDFGLDGIGSGQFFANTTLTGFVNYPGVYHFTASGCYRPLIASESMSINVNTAYTGTAEVDIIVCGFNVI